MVLVIAAIVSGCIENKTTETASTNPVSTAGISPVDTASSTPGTSALTDEFGTEADIAAIDSIINDTSMDISLSDSPI